MFVLTEVTRYHDMRFLYLSCYFCPFVDAWLQAVFPDSKLSNVLWKKCNNYFDGKCNVDPIFSLIRMIILPQWSNNTGFMVLVAFIVQVTFIQGTLVSTLVVREPGAYYL